MRQPSLRDVAYLFGLSSAVLTTFKTPSPLIPSNGALQASRFRPSFFISQKRGKEKTTEICEHNHVDVVNSKDVAQQFETQNAKARTVRVE